MIRAITADDYEEWLKLWKDYQQFYQADIPDAVSRVSFARMLDPREPMYGALATDGQHALGLVHWIFHRSNWTTGDYCYLQDLYVSKQSRRGGIGRALIEHVYAAAKKADCSRVYWLTHQTNTQAQKLYEQLAAPTGFIQYKHVWR